MNVIDHRRDVIGGGKGEQLEALTSRRRGVRACASRVGGCWLLTSKHAGREATRGQWHCLRLIIKHYFLLLYRDSPRIKWRQHDACHHDRALRAYVRAQPPPHAEHRRARDDRHPSPSINARHSSSTAAAASSASTITHTRPRARLPFQCAPLNRHALARTFVRGRAPRGRP